MLGILAKAGIVKPENTAPPWAIIDNPLALVMEPVPV
jgi:hypothetical protein